MCTKLQWFFIPDLPDMKENFDVNLKARNNESVFNAFFQILSPNKLDFFS